MDLVVEVYALCASLPDTERYGLSSQICRAAVSVPSNIAEGHGRRSTPDYAKFLSYSLGSVREVQTLLLVIERLNLVPNTERLVADADRVAALVYSLQRAIRQKLGGDSSRDKGDHTEASAE